MEPVKVGVVGHGYFGAFHARHLEASPAAELVVIADPSEAAAEAIRASYGGRHATDYTSLIGRVDAVSIAVPTRLHRSVAADFIEAGIHVLVEKPLCESAAGGQQLAELAARRGVVLNVGHIERFSATYRRLRRELSGDARLIECQRHAPWRGRIVDVDVVLDMMIHDIDLVLDLARSEPSDVTASGVAMMGHGLDAVVARVLFANGSVAHFSANRVAPETSRIMRVVAPDRALMADLGKGKLGVYAADGKSLREEEIPLEDALKAEIDAFLSAVRGRSANGVDGRQAVAALSIVDRIRAAARTSGSDFL